MSEKSQILRLNEQVKGITGIGFNLGAVLIATTVARVALKKDIDLTTAFWLVSALVLIWLASMGLTLLESEE